MSREDLVNNWSESFAYDALNRLTSATIGIDIAKSFSNDPIGNLLTKSDVGNYAYPAPGQPFPHAVSLSRAARSTPPSLTTPMAT